MCPEIPPAAAFSIFFFTDAITLPNALFWRDFSFGVWKKTRIFHNFCDWVWKELPPRYQNAAFWKFSTPKASQLLIPMIDSLCTWSELPVNPEIPKKTQKKKKKSSFCMLMSTWGRRTDTFPSITISGQIPKKKRTRKLGQLILTRFFFLFQQQLVKLLREKLGFSSVWKGNGCGNSTFYYSRAAFPRHAEFGTTFISLFSFFSFLEKVPDKY